MPYRKVPIVSGEVYHIFNRSIARLPIFQNNSDFSRFTDLINYYRFKDTPASFSKFKRLDNETRKQILNDLIKRNDLLVEIVAYCLMDNHFHFLLKQIADKGVARFISNLQNGYAKFFNLRNERIGPLFQPMFKNVRIVTDEQLLHVSRYIHLNPSTSYLVEIKDLENYHWSSLSSYLKSSGSIFVDPKLVLSLISRKKYKEFVYDHADYQRDLGRIKHLTFE